MEVENKAVKLLIDITTDGKAYRAGMVEVNPSIWLTAWARDKNTMTRDGKVCLICEFTETPKADNSEETETEEEAEKGSKVKIIDYMSFKELKVIAKEKGITVPFGCKIEDLRTLVKGA